MKKTKILGFTASIALTGYIFFGEICQLRENPLCKENCSVENMYYEKCGSLINVLLGISF